MIITKEQSIFKYDSGKLGPKVVLMAGVHGNEWSGIFALQRLVSENINIKKGKLTIIFANLDAIEKNVRFVDINMNRCFGKELGNSKEEKRVEELLLYLQDADILLDLHNTIDLSAQPFVISEHNEYNHIFDCEYSISGLDNLHPGGSDGYMNYIGKVGLCLECGSIIDDIEISTNYAYDMSRNLLRYLGMIDGSYHIYGQKKNIACDIVYSSITNSFRLVRGFQEFEYCEKGMIIGYNGLTEVYAPYDGYIIFARNVDKIGSECFVYGK